LAIFSSLGFQLEKYSYFLNNESIQNDKWLTKIFNFTSECDPSSNLSRVGLGQAGKVGASSQLISLVELLPRTSHCTATCTLQINVATYQRFDYTPTTPVKRKNSKKINLF
jgi:hypothetical protein